MMSQMRFVVNNMTEIYDRRGNMISLRDLRPIVNMLVNIF